MPDLASLTLLRPCHASDDRLLYDIFCTTWQSEVAALPNQNLARHVLRIQHISQERRLAGAYPGYERFIVVHDDEPAGRLYVHQSPGRIELLDLTLLTGVRSRGIGAAVITELMGLAAREDVVVGLRVGRRLRRANEFYLRLGFDLVETDDLDNRLEWTPVPADASQPSLRPGARPDMHGNAPALQLEQATPRS